VTGNHTLEELEQWVTTMFAPVSNKNTVIPIFETKEAPNFNESSMGKLLRFVPVKDKDILTIYWPALPYSQLEYRSQPLRYFSHLFGHEGANSLLSHLKREGLAMELSAYSDHEIWAVSQFTVDITLTKKGL
jgi:insulysin